MIGFFRRIRKKLADDNQFFKYSRYAIGEIVLVMVGILLALQVNNWNENRKTTEREKLFLKEFKTSIDRDLLNYDENYGWRLERKKGGLDSLFHYMQFDNNMHDTLFIKFYINIRWGIRLRHDSGPYEALKSSGLDYIRNDSLRAAINRTYMLLPTLQSFSHRTDAENNLRISELEYKFLNLKNFVHKENMTRPEYEVKVDNILTNQDFLRVYALEQQKYDDYKRRLEQMKYALKELKSQIEIELKK